MSTVSHLVAMRYAFQRTALCVSFLVANHSHGADPIVTKIVSAWQRQQSVIQSMRFVVSGERRIPRGFTKLHDDMDYRRALRDVPEEDYAMPMWSEVVVDLQGGRLHRHERPEKLMQSKPGSPYVYFPHDEISIFDGETFQTYMPHELNLHKSPLPHLTGTE